jgi:multiple antibiotic resistance protein
MVVITGHHVVMSPRVIRVPLSGGDRKHYARELRRVKSRTTRRIDLGQLQALTLTFSSPGLSSINEEERRDAEKPGDIAVFPLAFPLIASPGALSAVVLLTGRAEGWAEDASILLMIGLCLILTYIAMRAADVLVSFLGQTGADVVGRISGVLLAGLAVQFIFDGLQFRPFA